MLNSFLHFLERKIFEDHVLYMRTTDSPKAEGNKQMQVKGSARENILMRKHIKKMFELILKSEMLAKWLHSDLF